MLILTRKINEDLFIGDNIVVTVLDIEGNYVKIGISAPIEINIVRAEAKNKFKKNRGNNILNNNSTGGTYEI